jgi:hypothetical protein
MEITHYFMLTLIRFIYKYDLFANTIYTTNLLNNFWSFFVFLVFLFFRFLSLYILHIL